MKQLATLSVNDFLSVVAGDEPVPGGGSVSALCAALAMSLGQMVARLTVGKKKYADVEESMKGFADVLSSFSDEFVLFIDMDAKAYQMVFAAYQLPKATDEEKAVRTQKIQHATKIAAEVPLQVAQRTCIAMDYIFAVATTGNRNAVTDACVAMMCARTAVLGALLNVRINLSSIQDEPFVTETKKEADRLENEARDKESRLLDWVQTVL